VTEILPKAYMEQSLTLVPTTAAPVSSVPTFTPPPDSSSQPRKGLNTDEDPTRTNTKTHNSRPTSATQSSFILPETVLAPTASELALPAETRPPSSAKGSSISPLAEHLLIAAGAIGMPLINT
jgi:hypothetical protein